MITRLTCTLAWHPATLAMYITYDKGIPAKIGLTKISRRTKILVYGKIRRIGPDDHYLTTGRPPLTTIWAPWSTWSVAAESPHVMILSNMISHLFADGGHLAAWWLSLPSLTISQV